MKVEKMVLVKYVCVGMYSVSSCWGGKNYGCWQCKSAIICSGEEETAHNLKVGNDQDWYSTAWDEGVLIGTSELSVGHGSGKVEFKDSGENGFAIMEITLIWWWLFV